MDDVGDTIEKIRIGHDGKGWGSGWHLDKVQVRRLLEKSKVRIKKIVFYLLYRRKIEAATISISLL